MSIKKAVAYLMCITMAAGLTGCGSDEESCSYSSTAAPIEGESFDAYESSADEADDGLDGSAAEDIAESPEAAPEQGVVHEEIDNSDKIGVLTAGEWNDNDNWGFFRNLISSGTITLPEYCFDVTRRIKVEITDGAGTPLPNVTAVLVDKDGNLVWSAVSGKDGAAYLFYPDTEPQELDFVNVVSGEASQQLPIEMNEQGDDGGQEDEQTSAINETMQAVLETPESLYEKMQVMFILDTTGSMGDEMLFLQSEFGSIAEAVGSDNIEYSVNFYRDKGDEYVTKCNPFTSDTAEISACLNAEIATGGGDHPEAVAEILTETLADTQWDSEAVKVAFLIFDAPPHSGTKSELDRAIHAASEQGIHVVPVVSSNSDRYTEIFARVLAVATNGTYVFLTDDSGVGGSHLEPIIGDYQVELLRDIIIRLIDDYRQVK
ncbi:MAG: VWA domain-containing protein [Ruminococcus sp.]|nr:VWA domain-containing protein [Ruminococcus sp.]